MHSSLNSTEEALTSYHEAAKLYVELQDNQALPIVYSEIAQLYEAQGQVDEALEYALKELELTEEQDSDALQRVAALYAAKGMEEVAEKYRKLASETEEPAGPGLD